MTDPKTLFETLSVASGVVALVREAATRRAARAAKESEHAAAQSAARAEHERTALEIERAEVAERMAMVDALVRRVEALESEAAECRSENALLRERLTRAEMQNRLLGVRLAASDRRAEAIDREFQEFRAQVLR